MARFRNDTINNFLRYHHTDPLGQKVLKHNNSGVEDPTYVGFTLKFSFTNDDFRNFAGGLPGTETVMTGLLLPESDIDSSINFLKRRQRFKEARALYEFVEQLKKIQEKKPWYFKSISGLSELVKTPPEGEPWRGKDKVITIECLESFDFQMSFLADLYNKSTYEMEFRRRLLPIDKRRFNLSVIVTEIRNLYEVIYLNSQLQNAYDGTDIAEEKDNSLLDWRDEWTQRYEMFERTARKNSGQELMGFSAKAGLDATQDVLENSEEYFRQKLERREGNIYQGDYAEEGVRQSNKFTETITDSKKTELARRNLKSNLSKIEDQFTFKIIKLYDCEFLFEDTPYLDTVDNSNAQPEAATFKFQIKVGDVVEYNQYGFWEWILQDVGWFATPGRNYSDTESDFHKGFGAMDLMSPNLKEYEQKAHEWYAWTHPSDYQTGTIETQAYFDRLELENSEPAVPDQPEAAAERYGGKYGIDIVTTAKKIDQRFLGNQLEKLRQGYLRKKMAWVATIQDAKSLSNMADLVSFQDPFLAVEMVDKINDIIQGIKKGTGMDSAPVLGADKIQPKNAFSIDEITVGERSSMFKKTGRDIWGRRTRPNFRIDYIANEPVQTGYVNIGDGYGDDLTNKDYYYGGKNKYIASRLAVPEWRTYNNLDNNIFGDKWPNVGNLSPRHDHPPQDIQGVTVTDMLTGEVRKTIGFEYPLKRNDMMKFGFEVPDVRHDILLDPLSGASPAKDIRFDKLTGANPAKDIRPDPLSGALPLEDITQDPLVGALPLEDITQDPLVGALPLEVITQDPLAGALPLEVITQDPLAGALPLEVITQDPLAGALPLEVITPDKLVGVSPDAMISQDPLIGVQPSVQITPDELTGAKPKDEITPDKFNTPLKNNNITPIKFESVEPKKQITKQDYGTTKTRKNISPDPLSGIKPSSKITSDKLMGIEPKTNIIPEPLTGVEPKTGIVNFNLTTQEPKTNITPLRFESNNKPRRIQEDVLIGAKRNNTIEPLTFSTISKKPLQPSNVNFSTPKHKIEIVPVDLSLPNKNLKSITPILFESNTPSTNIQPIELIGSKPKTEIVQEKRDIYVPKKEIQQDTLIGTNVKRDLPHTNIELSKPKISKDITTDELIGTKSNSRIHKLDLEPDIKQNKLITQFELKKPDIQKHISPSKIDMEKVPTKKYIMEEQEMAKRTDVKTITQDELTGVEPQIMMTPRKLDMTPLPNTKSITNNVDMTKPRIEKNITQNK